jgi:hypothetical protein
MNSQDLRNICEAYTNVYEPKELTEQEYCDVIIFEYLIDEGFAETEEAAHSIMASMSEGWKQSIVDEEVDSQGNRSHDLFTGEKNPGYNKPTVKPKKSLQSLPKPGTPAAKKAPMRDEPLW